MSGLSFRSPFWCNLAITLFRRVALFRLQQQHIGNEFLCSFHNPLLQLDDDICELHPHFSIGDSGDGKIRLRHNDRGRPKDLLDYVWAEILHLSAVIESERRTRAGGLYFQ